jgi:hypothetical protein
LEIKQNGFARIMLDGEIIRLDELTDEETNGIKTRYPRLNKQM